MLAYLHNIILVSIQECGTYRQWDFTHVGRSLVLPLHLQLGHAYDVTVEAQRYLHGYAHMGYETFIQGSTKFHAGI